MLSLSTHASVLALEVAALASVAARSSMAVSSNRMGPAVARGRRFVSRASSPPSAIASRVSTSPLSIVRQRAQAPIVGVGEQLIPTMNKLQEIFALTGTKIDLPQIIVVGGQSSGKSSVLENLVGRDFLPRGSGIVTRRPLILQLTPLTPGSTEYGEFLHIPGKRFTDFEEIKREIEKDTERVCGRNKGVSNVPILLKIFSPKVLPLTLVDTPGIARVPIGDQPKNIEDQTKNLARDYIQKSNSIILAVHAANQDLATSDGLKLAREVDPEGARTVGVLTKVDLMDKGTDAMSILLGRQFPLRHGWTGVVNRSQQDIDRNKAIDDAHNAESSFFVNHSAYRSIADRCGSRVLAERCNKMLAEHIRKTLPEIRVQVKTLIKAREEELAMYGEPVLQDEASQGWQLMNLLARFSQTFSDAIQGNLATLEKSHDPTQLSGGARIRYIFNEGFGRNLAEVNPLGNLTNLEIRTAIRNAQGSKPALFVPDAAFEHLARKAIEQLRSPCLLAADTVHNELLRIVSEMDTKEIGRFWRLREKIIETTNDMIRKQLKEAHKMINTSIDLELSYINTSHPDFIGMSLLHPKPVQEPSSSNASGGHVGGASGASNDRDEDFSLSSGDRRVASGDGGGIFSSLFGRGKPAETAQQARPKSQTQTRPEVPIRNDEPLSDKEKTQVRLIRQLLESYVALVMKKLHDHVTKVVMMVLVNDSTVNLNRHLVSQLYKGDANYKFLLSESDDIAMKRSVARAELDALKRAKQVLKLSEMDGF